MFSNSSNGIIWDIDAKGASGSFGQISFSTNSSEAMRIDSSGNLLVGTTDSIPYNNSAGTSADFGFAVNKNFGFTSASAYNNPALLLNRTSTDGAIIDLRKDGSTVGSIGSAQSGDRTYFSGGSYGIASDTSDATIMPCNTTGGGNNGVVSLGKSDARFKDLYLSGGVYLGGTGSANKLDDYEEGTWTPTVYGTGTAGTATYTQAVGTYTKVGNLVYAQCFLSFSSFTGTDNLQVRGLPFNGQSGGYETHPGSCIVQNHPLPSGTIQVVPRAQDGQAYIHFKCTRDNNSEQYLQCASGPAIIELSVTYRTN
jgi:hypothetical protein